MKVAVASDVVMTRVLSDSEMDGVMASMGAKLVAAGFTPLVHTRRLLTYQAEYDRKRGIYVGVFAPIGPVAPGLGLPLGKRGAKVVSTVVQVTDLPVAFSVDGGPGVEVPVALAFGISAPRRLLPDLEGALAACRVTMEQALAGAGDFLAGMSFDKRVPGVECDHCGHAQEVTVPIRITRVDGGRGYGPGGSTTVPCSNTGCGRSFEVTWDSVVVELSFR